MGCEDFKLKPELSYKLSTTPVKAPPIGLANEDDWSGLVEDFIKEATSKRKSEPTVGGGTQCGCVRRGGIETPQRSRELAPIPQHDRG